MPTWARRSKRLPASTMDPSSGSASTPTTCRSSLPRWTPTAFGSSSRTRTHSASATRRNRCLAMAPGPVRTTQPRLWPEHRARPRAPMPQPGPGTRLAPTGAISASSCRCGSESEARADRPGPLRSPPPDVLSHFTARGFRNLQPLDLAPSPGLHLLLGGNGAGKTSLLEAIYVLATTRSFRTGQVVDCMAHGANELQLWGEVETDRRAALAVSVREGVRQRSVNGKLTSLADHLAVLPAGAWAAVETGVLVGAPGARRRFMDRGVVATRPAALETLGRYREALRQKRELLARNGTGIEIWNELLAATAAEVIRLRAAYVDALRVELAAVLAEVGEVREITTGAGAEAAASAVPLPDVPAAEADRESTRLN